MESNGEVDCDPVIVLFVLIGELEVPGGRKPEEEIGFKFGVGGFMLPIPPMPDLEEKGPVGVELIKKACQYGVAPVGEGGMQKFLLAAVGVENEVRRIRFPPEKGASMPVLCTKGEIV